MKESSPNVIRVATAVPGRKFDRLRAKMNMRKAGFTQLCKKRNFKGEKYPSKFALHWRDYTDIPTVDLRRTK